MTESLALMDQIPFGVDQEMTSFALVPEKILFTEDPATMYWMGEITTTRWKAELVTTRYRVKKEMISYEAKNMTTFWLTPSWTKETTHSKAVMGLIWSA